MPYRDAAPTLGDALAGVLADLGPGDEVIAVDDGSRDESASVVD
ncbi:MAG: glycosyltransferase, partial [Gemmatimonadetes bacterium]|nr:glycosyltransferase [Gemmatimonadota bacterium]